MRWIRKATALGALSVLAAAPLAAQEAPAPEPSMPPSGTSMVFVNTGAILPIAPGADAAQAQFQTELEGYQAELAALATELDSLVARYRRQEAMLDPAAKEQRQQEILDKQQAAQNRQFQLEQQSETRRGELLKPILDNVREIIEQIRAEREYSIVFDIAESGVIAADPELDITEAVLSRLGVEPPADSISGR